MAEKWERSYSEIAAEAGESSGHMDALRQSWAVLFKILRKKFEPIVDLTDYKLAQLSGRMAYRESRKEMLYLFDTELCSFCRRAMLQTGQHPRPDGACRACILKGKCFDDSWLIKPIYKAIRSGDYVLFRRLIRQGLSDIAAILKAADDRDLDPT